MSTDHYTVSGQGPKCIALVLKFKPRIRWTQSNHAHGANYVTKLLPGIMKSSWAVIPNEDGVGEGSATREPDFAVQWRQEVLGRWETCS